MRVSGSVPALISGDLGAVVASELRSTRYVGFLKRDISRTNRKSGCALSRSIPRSQT